MIGLIISVHFKMVYTIIGNEQRSKIRGGQVSEYERKQRRSGTEIRTRPSLF